MKEYVHPDRNGMMCYSVKLVGSCKIWIWRDGTQVWEQGDEENRVNLKR